MSRRAWIALPVALAAAVFLQVRSHGFVDIDDPIYIAANPWLADGLGAHAVWRAFSTPYETNWIPLTWLSLQLDHALYGREPAGYLLTNVALHAAAGAVLLVALARMTGQLGPSAFVAAVFAVHPLHVESVAWASERKDVLSGLFWMLTLLAYARYAERPGAARGVPVLLAFALGLLAKPMLVTLPCVLLLLDGWPLQRLRGAGARQAARLLLEKLPLFALAAAAAVVTYQVQQSRGAMLSIEALPLGSRLANALESYVVYAAKSLWPTGLAAFYPHPEDGIPPLRAAGAALLLVAVSAAVLRAARRAPYLAVGWLWYLGTLVPVIGLVQVGEQARADRYMYLPLVGLSILLAWGARDLARLVGLPRRALAAAAVLAVALLAALAWRQVGTWRDTETLFAHALAVTGDNPFAHNALGDALAKRQQLDAAARHYEAALRLRPGWASPLFGLADVRMRRGDVAGALASYERLRAARPDDPRALLSSAFALIELGRDAEARRELERAEPLDLGMRAAELHAAWAQLEARAGREAEAARRYRAALAINPGLRAAANNLAWLLATGGDASLRDPAEAVALARGLVATAPEPEPALLDTLAAAYAAAGDFAAAAETAAQAEALAAARGEEALRAAIAAHGALYRSRRALFETAAP